MEKNKGGRPRKIIDKVLFEKLCSLQCTQEEILSVIDCDDKTLTRWCKDTYKLSFSEIFNIKRQNGKVSLRRTQWKLADENVAMAIWLGKQYLNQREQIEDKSALEKLDKLLEMQKGV